MSVFRRSFKPKPIPKECEGLEVKVQSSTCTGERTIGFFDRVTGRLLYSELVRSEKIRLKKIREDESPLFFGNRR